MPISPHEGWSERCIQNIKEHLNDFFIMVFPEMQQNCIQEEGVLLYKVIGEEQNKIIGLNDELIRKNLARNIINHGDHVEYHWSNEFVYEKVSNWLNDFLKDFEKLHNQVEV